VPAKERSRRTRPAEPKAARPSALDAAARVLAEEMRPMGTRELIGAMAVKGYWTSPGGKTPAATLYSAILSGAPRPDVRECARLYRNHDNQNPARSYGLRTV
jgi:hypothetical protein